MATNYPTSLDDNSTLGPNVANALPVTDPVHHIDATHKNNTRDAVVALETKVGVDGSAAPSSLDFRIAALESAVAGLSGIVRADVGDSGISATFETDLFYDDTISLATDLPCHAAGSVVGLGAKYGGAITAGDINVHVAQRSNGTGPPIVLGPGVLQVVLDAVNGRSVVATFTPGVHTFAQGDTLTVVQTPSAGFVTGGFDLTASILMRYD